MKSRGFTLVEVLGIIVVLGIIAVIATPVVQGTIEKNREKMFDVIMEQLTDSAKDWAAKNASQLPNDNNEYLDVSLGDLKTNGVLKINVQNPKSNNVFSDESFVRITRNNNNFTYEVYTYDLVTADEVEDGAPTITLKGDQIIYLEKDGEYVEEGTLEDKVSIQILKDGKEVSSVETSTSNTYTIYYSLLENNKLGINVRTVIIK